MSGRLSQRQLPASTNAEDTNIEMRNVAPAAESPVALQPISRKDMDRPDLRAWCVGNVAVSFILATTTLVLGILIVKKRQPQPDFLKDRCANYEVLNIGISGQIPYYVLDHFAFPSTASGSWILLLAAEVLLTLIFDAHDRIYATALIWILQEDRKEKAPSYNTNGQLLSGTRRFGPCHLSVNALSTISMSMCFGAAATMITRIEVQADCSDLDDIKYNFSGPHYGVDISGYALLMLGAALMVQNLRSVWLLIDMVWLRRPKYRSWSLDPVVNSLHLIDFVAREQDRAQTPRLGARTSLHEQVTRARVLVRMIWVVAIIVVVAVGIAAYFAKRGNGFDPIIIADLGGNWQYWGFAKKYFPGGTKKTNWAGPLIQSGMQGLLALSLHFANVVLGFRNDEKSWQEAYSRYADREDAFVPHRYRPRRLTILLFMTKTAVQWMLSYAVVINVFISVSLVPLSVVAVLVLLVVIVLEIVTRRTPRGGAETTYGEFRLLEGYIRRYHSAWLLRSRQEEGRQ